MISATICHLQPTTHDLPPGAWWLQLCKSLDQIPRSIYGSIQSGEIGSVLPLESALGSIEPSRLEVYHLMQLGTYLRACLAACLQASWEPTSEHIWLQVYLHAQLGPLLRAYSEEYLRMSLEVYLGTYLAWTWTLLGSLLGSIQSTRCGMCDWVELEAYLRSYLGVYLRASWELTWEHAMKCIQLYCWMQHTW